MAAGAEQGREWFGQPRGLTVLFLTATWEQFSFYGMRTLLVYYMTKQLLFTQQSASYTYGLYTAVVYFTPIVGGYIADRWLGRYRAVLIGGSIMALGHFLMASEDLFYVALATIAVGNGLFLPSLPSQIPGLYRLDDARRGRAYNVYYMGVNLGAMFAPFICGTIGEVYGWHYGFAVAGFGMMAGMAVYIGGSRYLTSRAIPERATPDPTALRGIRLGDKDTLARFTLLGSIAAVVILFRGAYEQIGNTLALWADTGVDRTVTANWAIPMTWFQSLNPCVVLLFTPVILSYWRSQAERGREPSSVAKMAIGAALVALSYLMLAAVAGWADAGQMRAPWPWLAAFMFLLTIGELFILPTGLGLFARLAPHGYAATCVALWFLAAFFGNLLAGSLGSLWSQMGDSTYFLLMSATSGLCAAALLAFATRTTREEAQSLRDAAEARQA